MIVAAVTPETVIRVCAIVLIFGLMIVVHELGHLILARMARMRVHEFSIGFGPALLSVRKVAGRRRLLFLRRPATTKLPPTEATPEYRAEFERRRDSGTPPAEAAAEAARMVEGQRASARTAPPESVTWSLRPFIPLGGYVNIAGIDPGEDVPDGFDKKPVSWRMAVVVAGSLMNVVMAIIIYIMTGSVLGVPGPAQPAVGNVLPGRPAAEAGLQAGDRFVRVGDVLVSDTRNEVLNRKQVRQIRLEIEAHPGQRVPIVVERGERRLSLSITPSPNLDDTPMLTIRGMRFAGMPHHPPYVERVQPDTPAERAGLERGDLVLRAAGERVEQIGELHKVLAADSAQSVDVVVKRDGTRQTVTLAPSPPAERKRERELKYRPVNIVVGQIGIIFHSPIRRLPLGAAIRQGFAAFADQLHTVVSALVFVLKRQGPAEVTGPVGITRILYQSAEVGWRSFLDLAAALCLWIAVFNLIPLPALDGGRLAFLAGEAVRGKPVIAPAREAIVHVVGLMLLLAVVLLVTYRDIVDWVQSR